MKGWLSYDAPNNLTRWDNISGTQLTSRPLHAWARPQRVIVVAAAKTTKAADIRGWTADEIDEKALDDNRGVLDSGVAKGTKKV